MWRSEWFIFHKSHTHQFNKFNCWLARAVEVASKIYNNLDQRMRFENLDAIFCVSRFYNYLDLCVDTGQMSMAQSSRLIILSKNIYTLWCLPVTIHLHKVCRPFFDKNKLSKGIKQQSNSKTFHIHLLLYQSEHNQFENIFQNMK